MYYTLVPVNVEKDPYRFNLRGRRRRGPKYEKGGGCRARMLQNLHLIPRTGVRVIDNGDTDLDSIHDRYVASLIYLLCDFHHHLYICLSKIVTIQDIYTFVS